MATIGFYYDARKAKGREAPINISIAQKGKTVYLTTGLKVLPEHWDGRQICGRKDSGQRNAFINFMKSDVEHYLLTLVESRRIYNMTAQQIKEGYLEWKGVQLEKRQDKNNVLAVYQAAMSTKKKQTAKIYQNTLNRLRLFDPEFATRRFEDITIDYLQRFENFFPDDRPSTANIHLRNIRAVFNYANDEEITTSYPFRKLKLKRVATMDRSLSVEQLRKIWNCVCPDWQKEYVDIFKLMFYLCGINIGDMALLDKIHNGRIEYDRQKTGKHYSIKVEPEAMEIINRYRGETHLLNILDRYGNYVDYLQHLNAALKKVGMDCPQGLRPRGKPIVEGLSTYYARYSWASIAAELDIPKETIAAALGHTQMDVTAIYIRTDYKKKIDAANRAVIDYVLYDIKPKGQI